MLTVQLLPLIIQVPLGEMLDVQQPLHDLIHGAVDERQGQVTQRGVGQTLLKRAVNQGQTSQHLDCDEGTIVIHVACMKL